MEKRDAEIRDIIIIRLVFEQVFFNAPKLCKGAIPKLQATIRAKHHDGFVQAIKGFALGFDHRVILGPQVQLAGNVLKQDQQSTHRVALARHF